MTTKIDAANPVPEPAEESVRRVAMPVLRRSIIALSVGWLLIAAYFFAPEADWRYAALSSYPDTFHFIWNVWWLQGGAGAGSGIYDCPVVFAPSGTSLYLHTLTEGVILPVARIFPGASPILLYNALLALVLALDFACAFLLLRDESGSITFGLLAALGICFHPFVIGHLDAGHLNILALFPALCAVRVAIRRDDPSVAGYLAGACFVALTAFVNLYYFYDLALLAVLTIVATACANRATCRLALRRVVMLACGGLVISGYRLWQTFAAARSGLYTPNHRPEPHSIDLAALIVPGRYQRIGEWQPFHEVTSRFALIPAEHGVAIGCGLLVAIAALAVVGRARPRGRQLGFGGVAILFFALSAGPTFRAAGVELGPNPIWYALHSLPLFPSVPARFAVVGQVSLWLLAASLLPRLRESSIALRAAMTCAVAMGIVETLPTSPRVLALARPPALERLAAGRGLVHDAIGSPEQAMYHQTIHGRPITRGFVARQPRAALAVHRRNAFLKYLEQGFGDASAASEGWRSLGLDAVLISAADEQRGTRLAALGWLEISDRDETVLVFRRRDDDRTLR